MREKSVYLKKLTLNADVLLSCLLFGLSVFFCWLEIGRFGIFGSSVDWISQHSVIPEYFRQQFYATGELFPEYAMGLGGGQNIYNFSYYGLYSPLLLPSYLLPFVRMGDYLMAVSMLAAGAATVIFYGWQRSQGKPRGICFFAALMLLLSGPMIFHSARHVMFVNYMPFLCMALWGVDRYLRRGKPGVYLSGVFLMIMTSFYYSIGGLLVLVIYGIHRYLLYREHPEMILTGTVFFADKKRDVVRLFIPMFSAVLLSAFFLIPTAAALVGKRSGGIGTDAVKLLLPKLSLFGHLYSSYGVGLTTFLITVLISGIFWREWSSRVLVWSSLAVMLCPIFMWILNGGLYVREKALIPFLPLFCYLIACYCVRVEGEDGKESGCNNGRIRKNMLSGSLPYAAVFVLLCLESGCHANVFLKRIGQLTEKLQNGGGLALADRWELILLDALLMLVWYFLCRIVWRLRGRRNGGILLVLPVLFLVLFGTSFRNTLHVESREFYEKVNQKDIGKAIEKVLARDEGFFRIEQMGSSAQQAANINRVWNARQYISSVYSSSYNRAYQEFRMNTFDVEEPTGNFMMQRSSANPVFQRLMGVRYLVKVWKNQEMAADKENSPFGYEWYLQEGCVTVYKNQNVAPICYATDRLISEDVYEKLEFPMNQIVLEKYAVREDKGVKAEKNSAAEAKEWQNRSKEPENRKIKAVRFTLPEIEAENGRIIKMENGYRICAEKKWELEAEITGAEYLDGKESRLSREKQTRVEKSKAFGTKYAAEKQQSIGEKNTVGQMEDTELVLYLQFRVKNREPENSVSIWVDGIQNTLSAASGYFYYNHNTAFTYAVPIRDTQEAISVILGKGDYEITDLHAFLADLDTEGELYQSEFIPDWSKMQNNRIVGQIEVQNTGYFVTSIPYDNGFEVRVDGKVCPVEKVNTAFLGFPIEEGRHEVEITYHAPGTAVGRLISLIGLLLTLWCFFMRKIKRKSIEKRLET